MKAKSSPQLLASLMISFCWKFLTASSLSYRKFSSLIRPPTFTICSASLLLTSTTLQQRENQQYSPSLRFYPFTTKGYRPIPPPPRAEGWRQREWQRSMIVTCMMSPMSDVNPSSSRLLMRFIIPNCVTRAQYAPSSPPSSSCYTCAPCAPVFTRSSRS